VIPIKILAVSGYKAHEIGIFKNSDPAIDIIKKAIRQHLLAKIDEGLEWVIVSGQLGVEMWAAEVTIELKDSFPSLQLAVLTPFENQEEKWNEVNKEQYEYIVMNSDFTSSISKKKYENPQQFRNKNQFMIKKSDGLLMLYDEEMEGSPKFLWNLAKQYTESNPYKLTQITFQDLQWIAEEQEMNHDTSILD